VTSSAAALEQALVVAGQDEVRAVGERAPGGLRGRVERQPEGLAGLGGRRAGRGDALLDPPPSLPHQRSSQGSSDISTGMEELPTSTPATQALSGSADAEPAMVRNRADAAPTTHTARTAEPNFDMAAGGKDRAAVTVQN